MVPLMHKFEPLHVLHYHQPHLRDCRMQLQILRQRYKHQFRVIFLILPPYREIRRRIPYI